MYVVKSELNYNWEVETLDELLYELDILNVKNRRKGVLETLSIFETSKQGEILNEKVITLPTDESIDQQLKDFTGELEELSRETMVKDINEIEDITDEEREVFEKLHTPKKEEINEKKNYKEKQRRIIETLNKNVNVEEEIYTQPSYKPEYQMPLRKEKENQPTVYEATTIIPVQDLKMEFKLSLRKEAMKIDEQIEKLEKEREEYYRLMNAMDNIG